MQPTGKQQALTLLATALGLFVLAPALFVYLADPCHLFHKPLPGPFFHGFTDMNPCQNAGLINTYLDDPDEGFDSVMTGTSLSTNFISGDIAKFTKWKRTLKITMPASSPSVQQVFVKTAIETGNVRHVFWEIFPYKYLPYRDMPPDGPADELGDFPVYLFNKSRLDDYRYIFNYSTLTAALNVVLQDDYFNRPSIDHVNYWNNQCEKAATCTPFKLPEDINRIGASYTRQHHALLPEHDMSRLRYTPVDRYVLATVLPHCNGATSFDLFIPPVSMNWLSQLPGDAFDYQLYLVRYLVKQTASCKNMRVFAFDRVHWITGDLSHYSDDFHFFGNVQDYLLQSFGSARHVITTDNIAEFEADVIEHANTYHPWGSTQAEIRNRSR